MTGEEFDDFVTLWRDEPSPEEQAALEALARQTSRRARLMQWLEIGVGILLLLALLVALAIRPAPAALAGGGLIVAVLIWSAWRRYSLARIAFLVDTSDREVLLENAIVGVEAKLRRSRIGLWLFVPGYVLGAVTGHAVLEESLSRSLNAFLHQMSPFRTGGLAIWAILAITLSYFLREHRRVERELLDLRDVQRQYGAEAKMDALASL